MTDSRKRQKAKGTRRRKIIFGFLKIRFGGKSPFERRDASIVLATIRRGSVGRAKCSPGILKLAPRTRRGECFAAAAKVGDNFARRRLYDVYIIIICHYGAANSRPRLVYPSDSGGISATNYFISNLPPDRENSSNWIRLRLRAGISIQ